MFVNLSVFHISSVSIQYYSIEYNTHNIIYWLFVVALFIAEEEKVEKPTAKKTAVKEKEYKNYKQSMQALIPGVFIDADIDEEKAMHKAVNKAVKKAVKKVVKDVSSDSEEDVFS